MRVGLSRSAGALETETARERRPVWLAALLALLGVSTVLQWLAAHGISGLWIMPDEAVYAQRGLAFWHTGHLAVVTGAGAGYSVLYPVFAGAALSVGSPTTGYAILKIVQALVVSLAAVPVFFYGRRVMGAWWALLAAALSLASPILLYAGFVMTEVLFYPLAAWALLSVAQAVATARRRDELVALGLIAATVLTRIQGVVLLGVFAMAVVADAAATRNPRRLRSFPLMWLVLVGAVVGGLLVPGSLGAYAATLHAHYPVGLAISLTWDHLAYAALVTGALPAVALVLLVIDAARGGLRPAERALVAVAASAVLLVGLQVGLFASSYAPHLLERDLAALPPILFIAFTFWLSRAPARSALVVGVAIAVFAAMALTPWDSLVAADAVPDSFSLAILERAGGGDPAVLVAGIVAALLALFVLLPRRLLLLLPLAVLGVLGTSTVVAADQLRNQVRFDQINLVGRDRRWIDRSANGPVADLYDGERYWNGVWETVFWNRKIKDVVSIAPTVVPGPLPQRMIRVRRDGRIPVPERYIVATDPHTFAGTRLAHLQQNGLDVTGLTLWRLDPPARLSTIERGIQVNGDMTEPATLTVYDCANGRLELTLLPKETRIVTVRLDGHIALRASVAGLAYWNGTVWAPKSASPQVCHFTIDGQTLLGSTRIIFVRRPLAEAAGTSRAAVER